MNQMRRICLIMIILIILILCWLSVAGSQQWESLGLSNEVIRTIVIHPSTPETIYVGTANYYNHPGIGGIFKSVNGGARWDILIAGLDISDIAMHPKNSEILYAACGAASLSRPGVIKTIDSGEHWFAADSGIYVDWEIGVHSIAMDPFHPDTLYAATGGFGHGEPYKSIDGGKLWFSIKGGLEWPVVTTIAIDEKNPDIVYMGTDMSGDVRKTMNGGVTWERLFGNYYGGGIVHTMCIDPDQSNNIYIGGIFNPEQNVHARAYMSSDGGINWINIDEGLKNYGYVTVIHKNIVNNKLYLGTGFSGTGYGTGIYVRSENDFFWSILDTMGLDTTDIRSLVLNPQNSNIIYAGTSKGIFKYHDNTNINISLDGDLNNKKLFWIYNYPNPFNDKTTIVYCVPQPTSISLIIYNINGQIIKSFFDVKKKAEYGVFTWDGKDNYDRYLPSGIYWYEFECNYFRECNKIVLIR